MFVLLRMSLKVALENYMTFIILGVCVANRHVANYHKDMTEWSTCGVLLPFVTSAILIDRNIQFTENGRKNSAINSVMYKPRESGAYTYHQLDAYSAGVPSAGSAGVVAVPGSAGAASGVASAGVAGVSVSSGAIYDED